jgi:hypothetical protein
MQGKISNPKSLHAAVEMDTMQQSLALQGTAENPLQ